MPDAKKAQPESKDNLAFVIGGIFILGLVFATYTYFNKTPDILDENGAKTETSLEKIKEMLSDKLNGEGTSTETVVTQENSTTKDVVTMGEWVATDYEEGDIQSGTSYTVKSGDTLWEIAEAVYGNGAEWTQLLSANTDAIGYLPNGSQALIVTGQVLVIN